MVIHHTRCGLETFEEATLADGSRTTSGCDRRFDWAPIVTWKRTCVRRSRPARQPFVDATEIRASYSTSTTATCERSVKELLEALTVWT